MLCVLCALLWQFNLRSFAVEILCGNSVRVFGVVRGSLHPTSATIHFRSACHISK
jgi:hypothetical protein